jgi:hypothetical protein
MEPASLTAKDQEEVIAYFDKPLDALDVEYFEKKLKELRKKYHPDNFEHLGNDVVKEMAHDKFKAIERLAAKIKAHLGQGAGALASAPASEPMPERYAGRNLKIEIKTRNKDLKYLLFGKHYRWLEQGDRFKIPGGREAYLVTDTGHTGSAIGFTEVIRLYLTFGENDPLDEIVRWLYEKLKGQADALLIEQQLIEVDLAQMLVYIKGKTSLRLT